MSAQGGAREPAGDGRRAALVVGATGGIGRAISVALVEERYDLSVTGRRPESVHRLVEELGVRAGSVEPIVADVATEDGPREMVAAHVERFGRLDLLVLSAGTTQRRSLVDTDAGRIRRLLDVNVTGAVALLAAALPAMRRTARTGPGAVVVLLSSVVAARPLAGFGIYSATKAAVSSLARSVNEEENEHGIRATAVCPGYVDTALTEGVDLPSGPLLPASDVAEGIRFLTRLSPGARVPSLEIARATAEEGRP